MPFCSFVFWVKSKNKISVFRHFANPVVALQPGNDDTVAMALYLKSSCFVFIAYYLKDAVAFGAAAIVSKQRVPQAPYHFSFLYRTVFPTMASGSIQSMKADKYCQIWQHPKYEGRQIPAKYGSTVLALPEG